LRERGDVKKEGAKIAESTMSETTKPPLSPEKTQQESEK